MTAARVRVPALRIEQVEDTAPNHVSEADYMAADGIGIAAASGHVTVKDVDAALLRKDKRDLLERNLQSVKDKINAYNDAIDRQTGPSVRVGDYLIQGGSLYERSIVATELALIATTQRGKEFFAEAAKTGRQERIIIDNAIVEKGSGGAHGDFHYGVVALNFKASNNAVFETTRGWQTGQRIAVLAHEMGHIHSRIYDTGLGSMDNVRRNENPIRRELGYAERVQYGERSIRYDQLGGPGIYETRGDALIRVGGLPKITRGK